MGKEFHNSPSSADKVGVGLEILSFCNLTAKSLYATWSKNSEFCIIFGWILLGESNFKFYVTTTNRSVSEIRLLLLGLDQIGWIGQVFSEPYPIL